MNKKILILIVLILVGISYYLFSQNIFTANNSIINQVSDNSSDQLIPNNVPDGWKTYSNTEWGMAFAYPKEWVLSEKRLTSEEKEETFNSNPVGTLMNIQVNGNGYSTNFNKSGRGFGQEGVTYSHPEYIVNGNITRTWENTDNGLFLVVSTDSGCNNISIFAENKNSTSKETINKILNSIICK